MSYFAFQGECTTCCERGEKNHIEQIAQFNSSELAHSQQITNAWTQAASPFIVLCAEVM